MIEGQPEWVIIGGVVGLVALVGSAVFGFLKIFSSALSLREHIEFKDAANKRLDAIQNGQNLRVMIKTFDDWREQFRHDVDRVEAILRDMHNDLLQRVESREQILTAQAKHDELQRALARMQVQLDMLQSRIDSLKS